MELEKELDPLSEHTVKEVRAWLETAMSRHTDIVETNDDDLPDHYYFYDRLVSCGWLKEERDTGFRVIVYMPQLSRSFLKFISDFGDTNPSIDRTCMAVKALLVQAEVAGFGSNLRTAADILQKFIDELATWVGSLRELRSEMKGDDSLSVFFDKFLGSSMKNYESLSLSGNPSLYDKDIKFSISKIQFDDNILQQIANDYKREGIDSDVAADCNLIIDLMNKIKPYQNKSIEYNRKITHQAVNYMNYTIHVPSGLSEKITSVLETLAVQEDCKEFSTNFSFAPILSPELLRKPKKPKPEPVRRKIVRKEINWKAKARGQLRREHYQKLMKDESRLRSYLETHVPYGAPISDKNMPIDNADDLICRLQMRELQSRLSKGDNFAKLQQEYSVQPAENGEWTEHRYISGRTLLIEKKEQ